MNKQNKRERRRDREKERIATERERMEKKMKKLRYFKMNVDKICSYSRESKKKGRKHTSVKGHVLIPTESNKRLTRVKTE